MQKIQLLTSGWDDFFLKTSYKSRLCFKNIVLNDGCVLEIIFYKLQSEELKLPISLNSYFKPDLHIWQFLQRWTKLKETVSQKTALSKVWMPIQFNLMVQVLFPVLLPILNQAVLLDSLKTVIEFPQRSSDPNPAVTRHWDMEYT